MFGLEPPSKRQRLDVVDDGRPPTETATATATAAEAKPPPGRERETGRNSTKWHNSQPHYHPSAPSNYPEPTSYASPHSTTNIRTVEASNTDPFHSSPGSWYQDGFSQDPGFLASQEELRAILFTLANSAAPTRASSPETAKRELDLDANASPTTSVSRSYQRQIHEQRRRRESPLSSQRRIEYLKNYVAEIAPWVRTVISPTYSLIYKANICYLQLDMFDSHCTFRQQLPALSHSFPALLYAILAISARQMERKSGIQDWYDSLELYQEAIRLLSPLIQVRDPKIVAACVLLCCLEMMSARAQDWHRHLEGCAALFEASGIHGFCGGLLQAVFWCYARMGEFLNSFNLLSFSE